MRYAIDIVPLDFSAGNVTDVRIKGFRRVVGSCLVQARGGLVLSDINGAQQKAIARCALIVEWDPQGAEETYRFVGMLPGIMLDSDEAVIGAPELEHVATIIAPGQPPFVIYRAPFLTLAKKTEAIEVVAS